MGDEITKLRKDYGEHGLHHDALEAKFEHDIEQVRNENRRCFESIGKINRELASWHSESSTLQNILDSYKDRYNEKLKIHSDCLNSKLLKTEKQFQTECQKIHKYYLEQGHARDQLQSLAVSLSTVQSALCQVQEDMTTVHKVSGFEQRISVLETMMQQTGARVKDNSQLLQRVTDAVSQ